jgi:hypothetical protein
MFGTKPTPQQVDEMDKFKGIAYQRNGNKGQDRNQANIPKVAPTPPKSNVYASS